MVQQEVYQDLVTVVETTVEYQDLQEQILTMEEYLEVQEDHQVDLVQTEHQEQEVQVEVEVELLRVNSGSTNGAVGGDGEIVIFKNIVFL